MNKSVLVLVVGLSIGLGFSACGGSTKKSSASGLPQRVLASQGVTTVQTFGALIIINGQNDTLPGAAPISAGSNPGLMAISPTRNILAAFDASSNSVYAVDTTKETQIGRIAISGPTQSMIVPTAAGIGYAAVPSATVNGYSFQGAIDVMNFSTGAMTTIAVPSAQTVVANSNATQLLVFSNDFNSITLLSPGVAVPPVDTSCLSTSNPPPPNAVCTIVPGFDRPVYAIVSGTTAYVLNCGPQCGGTQASIAIFDLGSLTITNTIPVDAATWAYLNGSTLYVAGTSPTNNACTGQTTAATTCGRLDVVDLSSDKVTGSFVITDGYHDRMDLSFNGQLFIGSHDCTTIGNVNNPSGEVRGCLSILNTTNGSVIIPPDNGDVNGIQGFTTRYVEYVAQGGNLRVYDTTRDVLLINDFVPQGSINIAGYIGDIKAIDFF